MLRRSFAFDDRPLLLAWLGCLAGLLVRVFESSRLAVNPDEAWQATLAFQPTWRQAWAEALTVHHPPLLLLLEHPLGSWLFDERLVRLVPMLAGSFAPLLAFVWIRRRAGLAAAAGVFLLLEFAPRMVSLGAQNRSYTLALFFVLAALYLLDRALEGGPAWYAAAGAAWVLAALSDYSVALLCPALTVLGLSRRWSERAPRAHWMAFAACVVAVLATYGVLYWIQIRPLSAGRAELDVEWLASGFPADDPLFAARAFARQFLYFFGLGPSRSVWYALIPVGAFVVALARHLTWWPLAILPFVTATITAYAGLFPYAGNRHTMLLGLPIAILLALLLGDVVRRARWVVAMLLPVTLCWLWLAPRDGLDFPRPLLVPAEHRAAAAFVVRAVPKMQPLLASTEAYHWLRYYLTQNGGFAPALAKSDHWRFLDEERLRENVRALRAQHGIAPGQPVWIAEGYFQAIGPRLGLATGPRRGGLFIYPLPADF